MLESFKGRDSRNLKHLSKELRKNKEIKTFSERMQNFSSIIGSGSHKDMGISSSSRMNKPAVHYQSAKLLNFDVQPKEGNEHKMGYDTVNSQGMQEE